MVNGNPRVVRAPAGGSVRARASGRSRRVERRELDRIRRVYAVRSARGRDLRYSAYATGGLLALHQRERLLLSKLGATCRKELHELDILDVGCGSGGDLVRLVGHDADAARIHGIDLREDVIATARRRLPSVDLAVANAAALPHSDRSMDVVMQSTVFSSILDAGLRAQIAAEMTRVVRPSGCIVSYDFWTNPLNRDTRGVSRRELRTLFPSHRVEVRSVTLAPPIARLVAPRSYPLAAVLQAVPGLRTHLLAFVTAPPDDGHGP
jgi:ubiquinone/menaquinone biosynthesis C-methylase UbiE